MADRSMPSSALEKTKGGEGETLALDYLLAKGYDAVCRNFRSRWGEIDLVVAKGDTIVFAEVKTRKPSAWVGGAEAVTMRKQERLRRTADWYLSSGGEMRQPRFDVLCVTWEPGSTPVIEHIENAF